MADPNDSVDDIPSDSLSMSSDMPEQEDMPPPQGQDQQNAEGASYFGQARGWVNAHPIQAASFGTVAAIAVVPALVAGPVLAAAGFGANGILAGSAAAGAHSSIGSVVAPSLFATLQSAGAGGYGAAVVHQAVSAAALGAGSAGALASRLIGGSNKDGDGEPGKGGTSGESESGGGGGSSAKPESHAEKAQDDGPQGHNDKAQGKAENGVSQANPKSHL